jgi:hypothetical protein
MQPLMSHILGFQPVLWLALQEYFNDPSDDCITRLYDAVNAMDISLAPTLSRCEKLIMRASERKDVFSEKFVSRMTDSGHAEDDGTVNGSVSSHSQSAINLATRARTDSLKSDNSSRSAEGSNASVGSSAVWVGEGSANDHQDTPRARSSLDDGTYVNSFATMSADSHAPSSQRIGPSLDTHFFETTITYKKTKLNIRLPLSTFPEEVGDVRAPCSLGPGCLTSVAVLVNRTYPDILRPWGYRVWPTSLTFAYQWLSDSSYHSPL